MRSMIGILDRGLERLSLLYLRLSQAILAALVAGVFAQVLYRYLFSRSILGIEELTAFALVWMVFLMSVVLHRRRRHIVVSVVVDILPPRHQRIAGRIVSVGTIVLSVYVLIQLHAVWPYLRLTTPVFGIPDVAVKTSPAFAFVPILLQEIVNWFGAPDRTDRTAGGL